MTRDFIEYLSESATAVEAPKPDWQLRIEQETAAEVAKIEADEAPACAAAYQEKRDAEQYLLHCQKQFQDASAELVAARRKSMAAHAKRDNRVSAVRAAAKKRIEEIHLRIEKSEHAKALLEIANYQPENEV